jgi:uncharacterized protein (TIGR03083 family)
MGDHSKARALTEESTMRPTALIDLMNKAMDGVTVAFDGLTEEQWSTATDCPGWDVKDNLSHIIGTEHFLIGKTPTSHRAPQFEHVKNPIGEMNENEIDVRRPLSGAEVYAEWKQIASERAHHLATADDAYFDTPWHMPTGPGTLGEFLSIRVLDLWVHEQDVRRALGKPGHESGPVAEHTIDRLIRTLPIVIGKRAATPEGDTVVIELTCGVTRIIPITVVDGRAKLVENAPANPRCTITIDSTTFLTLATGRGNPTNHLGGVSMRGDEELAMRVVMQLNMMI